MSVAQPDISVETSSHHAVSADSSSVLEFRQNYSDIDTATNDLLIPQKNAQSALKLFLELVENEAKKIGISFAIKNSYFTSPLENSCQSDLSMDYKGVTLAKISFFCKGKDLQEIHQKRGATLSPKSYPVEMFVLLREQNEIAYEFCLDINKDSRGLTALVRPFKHMIEGQPYRFIFDDNGHLNKPESQISRVHDHFNTTVAQLLFAIRQLGIEKREPSFGKSISFETATLVE